MAGTVGEPDRSLYREDSPEHAMLMIQCMDDRRLADGTGRSIGSNLADNPFTGGKTGGSRKYSAQDPCLFIRLSPGICGVHVQHAITDVPSLCMTPCMGTERVDCVNRSGYHVHSDVEEPCESRMPAPLIRESGYRDVVQTRRSGAF